MHTIVSPLLTSLLVSATPHTAKPWYERPTCRAAVDAVMAVELDDAERRIKELERGDLEDQACAAWTRVTMAETQIAVGGRMPALLENRERRLFQLFKFAKQHRNHRHLADLAIEARVRRVRVLVDKGEKTRALEESRAADKMLEARGKADNPTLAYVRGVVNMAVSQSNWGLRMVLRMAGVSGDAELGRAALEELAKSETVYSSDALYLRHFFAVESPSKENGAPAEIMRVLVDRYPTNPQLGYEYATDLMNAKDCEGMLTSIAPLHDRLEADPTLWSNMVRAKLYWVGGRCAANLGKRGLAKRWAELADQQKFEPMDERIKALLAEL